MNLWHAEFRHLLRRWVFCLLSVAANRNDEKCCCKQPPPDLARYSSHLEITPVDSRLSNRQFVFR